MLLVLHSDDGAPTKAHTMKAKMEELGVLASYSRPRISDDNTYLEFLFITLHAYAVCSGIWKIPTR